MRLRAAVLTVLAGVALAVPAAPASAAACSQGSGVTVVVDFASLGGGTPTRCASGDPTSGLAALRATGFTPTRAAQEPGYFVCRIDGKPANDPCQRTSPANAYWSYWHAKPGGSWAFSSTGAADYDPPPGSVEGWAFGAGKPPSSPPPRNEPPSPTAAPATSRVPAASPVATAAAQVRPTVTPSRSATAAVASPAASPSSLSPSSLSPSPVLSASDVPSPTAGARPAGPARPARGSAIGVLLAGGVLALLAAGGARLVWLRRRTGRLG